VGWSPGSDEDRPQGIERLIGEQKRKEKIKMRIDKQKLQIALATACMNPYDLCKAVEIQYQTYRRISGGHNCKPATVGKIAKALKVPVENLIDMEGGD